jgi:hypothetical protein
MTWREAALAAGLCLGLAACATPEPPPLTLQEQYEPESVQVPSPLVEYPPIEPVEPPIEKTAQADPPPQPVPVKPEPPPPAVVATAPPSVVAVPPAVATAPPPREDVELIVLLADLQRYGALPPDEVRRELANLTASLARQRTDANRVRLAVLYTLAHGTQDDQRALQLLDNVSRSNGGSPAVKQLAFVLQAQIVGRQRAVREEQQRADAALQKLEALRQMERSLMRERVRSGGGGGGSGSGGGSGGGGAGGGASGGG